VLVGTRRLRLRGAPGVCELVEEPGLCRLGQLELGQAGAVMLDKLLEDLLGAHVPNYRNGL
jgi:hypothetical protein